MRTQVEKDDGSSEDEGLFITQSSMKGDISAEIEGNVVERLDIYVSALIRYRLLKASFLIFFFNRAEILSS